MPTPTNAPSSTAPGGRQIQNPELFANLTERQAMPQTVQEMVGLGKTQRLILEKVGVVARIRLLIKFHFKTHAETTPKLNVGFPQRLLTEIALQANGVTGIIDCGAATLEQRRKRVYRNPVSAIASGPKGGETLVANTAYNVVMAVEIPIAHDMLSLIGALLAQNEETAMSVLLRWATEEEIASGVGAGLSEISGEVIWASTVFSIGSTVVGKQEVTVLPDLSAFHGILENPKPITANGNQRAELIRTAGQLLCYTATVLQKQGGQESLSPAEWTTFKLEYGGNKDPLVWTPASELYEENADDYDGPLVVNGMHFLAIDNERDNPSRDMIIPESLTELRTVIGIPGTFTPESAQIFATQETLYPAV